MFIFSSITDINGFFEIPPPPAPVCFDSPFVKFKKNLWLSRLFWTPRLLGT